MVGGLSRFFLAVAVPTFAENRQLPRATARTAVDQSNTALVHRLLGVAWTYRRGCLKVLVLQLFLLVGNVGGLGLAGIGIDFIAHRVDAARPSPRWPFGWAPPAAWSPMTVVALLAAGVLAVAILRAWLDFSYQLSLARLVQGEIVVDLRGAVYDKLQRLSFRFFDDHASGSIINRVTGDVQSLRSFVDLVLIQVFILALQFILAFGYMAALHGPLTIACLSTTPLLAVGAAWFSRAVRPAYVRNRELVDKLIGVLSENVQGAGVIKGFAREREEIAKFAVANDAARDQQNWIFWRLSTFIPRLGLVSQVNVFVLLA